MANVAMFVVSFVFVRFLSLFFPRYRGFLIRVNTPTQGCKKNVTRVVPLSASSIAFAYQLTSIVNYSLLDAINVTTSLHNCRIHESDVQDDLKNCIAVALFDAGISTSIYVQHVHILIYLVFAISLFIVVILTFAGYFSKRCFGIFRRKFISRGTKEIQRMRRGWKTAKGTTRLNHPVDVRNHPAGVKHSKNLFLHLEKNSF